MIDVYQGAVISNETVNWRNIKPGDVVVEGNSDRVFRTLTDVQGKYWEYLNEEGYYSSTSPEYCHYVVRGQKSAGRVLYKIVYDPDYDVKEQ